MVGYPLARFMKVQMICALCGRATGIIEIPNANNYHSMICQECFINLPDGAEITFDKKKKEAGK